jgi:hypothetical protein
MHLINQNEWEKCFFSIDLISFVFLVDRGGRAPSPEFFAFLSVNGESAVGDKDMVKGVRLKQALQANIQQVSELMVFASSYIPYFLFGESPNRCFRIILLTMLIFSSSLDSLRFFLVRPVRRSQLTAFFRTKAIGPTSN